MSFEVIKWVYNKTFVKIMKNTVHFRKEENSRLNKSDVKIVEDERLSFTRAFLLGGLVNLQGQSGIGEGRIFVS